MTLTALLAIGWTLRGVTIGSLLLLALVLLRDHRAATAARLGIALCVSTIASTICSGPGAHRELGGFLVPLLALTAGNNVVFWLFAAALFDDNFRLRRWQVAICVAMVLLGAIECVVASRWLSLALISSALVFAGLAVAPTLMTWRDDLLEGRRRLRLFVVLASAAYTAAITFAALSGNVHPVPGVPNILSGLALSAIVLPATWLTLGLRPEQGLFATLSTPPAEAFPRPIPVATAPTETIDPTQKVALDRAMIVDRAYRQDGLTIAQLADRLGLPEYRLRRLINQALGYRNFNSFLNFYRIADAKAALADPTQADVPVLTIALDAGFSSLGPFNRAFKAETGMTPSEFRRLGSPIPESASVFPNSASRISPAR